MRRKSMRGVDPYGYLQELSGRLDGLRDRSEIEDALDDLEYLFEVMPPDLQDLAEPVIETLRGKLRAAG